MRSTTRSASKPEAVSRPPLRPQAAEKTLYSKSVRNLRKLSVRVQKWLFRVFRVFRGLPLFFLVTALPHRGFLWLSVFFGGSEMRLTGRRSGSILKAAARGRTGFDLGNTPEAACRGRFVGLVNHRTKK